MILIGLGANLPTEQYGTPRAALGAALDALGGEGVTVMRRSPWYESAPVPISDQPWYVNGVAEIESGKTVHQLIATLLGIEARVGRKRGVTNAARVLDLDLLVYGSQIISSVAENGVAATVPHPRMTERAFVMLPLKDICPNWCHPESNLGINQLIEALPEGQDTRKLDDADGFCGTEWPGPLKTSHS